MASTSSASARPLNSYFVPGFGISRAVIQSQIRFHCGPDAIARPYTHQGRDGFLVTTSAPALTQEQVQDLVDASREYEEKQARRSQHASNYFVNQPVPVPQRQRRA